MATSLVGPFLHGEGVVGRAGAASAAADQGQPDRIFRRRVDVFRDGNTRQRGDGGHTACGLEDITTGQT